jgi:hypothetical protein
MEADVVLAPNRHRSNSANVIAGFRQKGESITMIRSPQEGDMGTEMAAEIGKRRSGRNARPSQCGAVWKPAESLRGILNLRVLCTFFRF